MRTLVVGSATLAILFVCFSMYQYAQTSNEPSARGPRLPSPGLEVFDSPSRIPADNPGVPIGDSVVGPGRNIQLTIYPREGSRAALDLEVRDWTPRPGAVNEFILVEPVFRLRTSDGNAVRVAAREGRMEASKQGAGDLNAKRGRLFGGVVVEFDRLTEEQRAALPEPRRKTPDPSELVRIELEEAEFDLDYDKLVVPGEVRLTASDATFTAHDVEARFNEAQNRLESLRIGRGGRLEIRGGLTAAGVPGFGESPKREVTLVDWLRETLQQKLSVAPPTAAGAADSSANSKDPNTRTHHDGPSASAPKRTADGVPVFRTDADGPKRQSPPVRYHARIEGDVVVEQSSGSPSRLRSDVLEIQRNVSSDDRRSASEQPAGESEQPPAPAPIEADGAIVVEWTRRLVIDALTTDDPRRAGGDSTLIVATGAPVAVEHADGTISCDRLQLQPELGDALLTGSSGRPAVVRSPDQGTMSGADIRLRRDADKFFVSITGPGELIEQAASRDSNGLTIVSTSAASPKEADNPQAKDSAASPTIAHVTFTERVEAEGRVVRRTVPTATGLLTTRDFRVLDRAVFVGQVALRQRDAQFDSDALEILFTERRSLLSVGQIPREVRARGNVGLIQGDDRLTCRELHATLRAEPDDRLWPERVEARGDIAASQGDRSITAADSLVVDFELAAAAPQVSDHGTQSIEAAPGTVASVSTASSGSAKTDDRRSARVRAKRVAASGDVTVTDASQAIDVRARKVDAALVEGRDIDTATIVGDDARPAEARMDDFSVAGREIRLGAIDQWAEIPGGGRLTFRSDKDLDGRKLDKSIPIAVTWTEGMRFMGRENKAVFSGAVHATSERDTTFDADRLIVEFEEREGEPKSEMSWTGLVKPFIDPYRRPDADRGPSDSTRVARRPAHLLATGNAVAVTAEKTDAGDLRTRARIAGPKLSVNLRPGFSRMLIEGAGTLLLEDFQPVSPASHQTRESKESGLSAANLAGDPTTATSRPVGGSHAGPKSGAPGLLAPGASSGGPSKTLITWRDTMWYDFAIDQTRFEGAVELKHFSGSQLDRVFRSAEAAADSSSTDGRSTFLKCDVLTAEFQDRKQRRGGDERMGRLNSSSLRQFQATGDVELQDETERLALWSDSVVFERERQIMAIFGSPGVKARIIKQEPGRLASHLAVDRAVYNLATGNFELSSPQIEGR